MSDEGTADENYPQRFIRIEFPVYVEWTDEGPNGDLEVREQFEQFATATNEEMIGDALENLEFDVTEHMRRGATIIRGEYRADEVWIESRTYVGEELDEPEIEEYDPGPEIDDEGGMSEYKHGIESEEPSERYSPPPWFYGD